MAKATFSNNYAPAYCEVDYLRPFNEERQHVKRKHVDVVV
jgi:hypothetical protein